MRAGHATDSDTGISPRVLWMTAGILWLVLGLVQLASFLTGIPPLPLPVSVVIITGILPVLVSAAWFACASAGIDDIRLFHLPLALGLLVMVTGSVLDPNSSGFDVTYPMLPMIVALVLFPLRHAWPYVIGGVLGACAFVMLGEDVMPWARVVVTAVVTLSIAGLLTIGQQQLRGALGRNFELSEIDALTGVANVRRLRSRLEIEINRECDGVDFALLAIDLDDFKAVNDALGHSTGDRVLVEVARAIENCLEPGEMVARRGGDEFTVVLFPHEDRSVENVRDQVAAAIEDTRESLCPSIEPGASIGLARHIQYEPLDAMLARADRALHHEKEISQRRRGAKHEGHLLEIVSGDDPAAGRLLAAGAKQVAQPWRQTHEFASWQLIGGVYATLSALVPLLGLVDSSSAVLTSPTFAVCLAAGVLGMLCFMFPERGGRGLRRLALSGTIVLAVALVALAGSERAAMIDVLVLPILLGFYVAGRRSGAMFAVAGIGAYIYFISTIDYAPSMIRIVQTSVMVTLVGYLVPHAIAQARATSDENERLAGVDPLTGLANVRRMNQRLGDELDRARSVGGYATVFMIDLDEFKQVNDTFGHQIGDVMLVAVARAISRVARDGDLVARRDGDEFLAIVPHAGEIDPEEIATRIEYEVCAARKLVCPTLNPDVSVGWVTGRPGDSTAELIARADTREAIVKESHRTGGAGIRLVA